MSIHDFTEQFILYKSCPVPDGYGGFAENNEATTVFNVALTPARSSERVMDTGIQGSIGVAQKKGLKHAYNLYIETADDAKELPAYGDYVKRVKNNDLFCVVSGPEDFRAPFLSTIQFCVLQLERVEYGGDNGQYNC